MTPVHAVASLRSWGVSLCAAGALLSAPTAGAADRPDVSEAQAAYQRDHAACMSGRTSLGRAACLREASAALRESGRGNLNDGQSDFERNRLLRCEKQPPEDRQDCVRRMSSEAHTSGSVEGGGVLREPVTPGR